MTEFGYFTGELEIRQGGGHGVLSGRMAYNQTATVASRGRVRKERLGPDAMGWQIKEFAKLHTEMQTMLSSTVDKARRLILEQEMERRNVHVLAGHSFDRPMGDLKHGTARITSDADSLAFEVDLPDPEDMPTYMADVVKEVRTQRAGGISPGFFMPPKDVVAGAEELLPEPGNPGVMIRLVRTAVMPELSIVTRPVYPSTVDMRADAMGIMERRAAEWEALEMPEAPTLAPRRVYLWL